MAVLVMDVFLKKLVVVAVLWMVLVAYDVSTGHCHFQCRCLGVENVWMEQVLQHQFHGTKMQCVDVVSYAKDHF